MAGTYDPQIVGSHFVKQYYTQLHKDPVQLHRFYLDQSSYVHGSSEIGSEEAVVGQKAIHEKILSINFKSVHAKIKQVDSHATLGEGIVIQVTGELSVNGQPMRAFVQTFVLAPESPKKYYVHNDIFRYQDDAYDITSESENNEGMTEREQDVVQVQPADLYQTGQSPQQQQQQQLTEVDISLQNGNRRSSIEQSPTGKEWTQYNDVSGHAESVSSDTSTPLEMLPPQSSDSPEATYKTNESDTGLQTAEDVRMDTPVGSSQEYPAEEDKGQLSWASRISQATGATITKSQPPASTPSQVIQQPPPPQVQQQQQPPPSQPSHEVRKKPSSENTAGAANRSGGGGGGGFGNQDATRRVARSVPDTYQLFVGGLPPNTTEQELRGVFEQYGRILEIRNNPNNFAFLVFDSEKPVKSILQKKDRDPPKIRGKQLNIEKKKPSEAVRMRTGGFRRDPQSGSGQRGLRGGPKNSKR